MKAPNFWQSRGGLSTALLPLAWLYALAGWLRWRIARPYNAGIPVICVGNAVAGGAGKTPVALAIAQILQQLKYNPHFLSRGYGRTSELTQAGPMQVMDFHSAADAGDEPLLLARQAPCWIDADRAASAQYAVKSGADILIMDDGLQNPGLVKTISLLVVDGATGFGNGRILPAGPLRESLACAFAKTDAVILVGEDQRNIQAQLPPSLPLFHGTIIPLQPLHELEQPIIAFAGIGRPEKFFTMLATAGVKPTITRSFSDHHHYTEADMQDLLALAQFHRARLTTTAKDAVKLPASFREHLQVVDIAFHFNHPAAFIQWLQEKLP